MRTGTKIIFRRTPAGVMQQFMADAKGAMDATVKYWHRSFMPNHFTIAGGRAYGYQLRRGEDEPPIVPRRKGSGMRKNPKYFWRKWRDVRSQMPLVYSGASLRAAKQNIRFTVRRTADGRIQGRAAMGLPTYFYAYRKDLKQPDKAAELLRTLPAEQADLTGVCRRYLTQILSQRRDTSPGTSTTV